MILYHPSVLEDPVDLAVLVDQFLEDPEDLEVL
jgi:hypothetical protein